MQPSAGYSARVSSRGKLQPTLRSSSCRASTAAASHAWAAGEQARPVLKPDDVHQVQLQVHERQRARVQLGPVVLLV